MPDGNEASPPVCPDCATRWWSTQKCTHISIPLPPLRCSPTSPVLLSYASYPHIIDTIAVNAPYSTQLAFRLTCRSLKRAVDSALSYHIEFGLCWGQYAGNLRSWIAVPDGRGLPFLFAPPPGGEESNDWVAEALSETRVVDVVDTGIFTGENIHSFLLHEWMRSQITPHTVRVRTPVYAPLPFRPRVMETYVDMACVPSYEVPASVRRHVIRVKVDEGALFGDWTSDATKGFKYEAEGKLKTVVIVLESMPEQSWHCTSVKQKAAWRDVLGALFRVPFWTETAMILVGFPEEEREDVRRAVGEALEYYADSHYAESFELPITEDSGREECAEVEEYGWETKQTEGEAEESIMKVRDRKGVLSVSFRDEWHEDLLLEAACVSSDLSLAPSALAERRRARAHAEALKALTGSYGGRARSRAYEVQPE